MCAEYLAQAMMTFATELAECGLATATWSVLLNQIQMWGNLRPVPQLPQLPG